MIYTLRLHMPGSLDHVNTYLIGEDKNFLMIDTGLPTQENIQVLMEYLKKYGSPKKVLITHYHPDHIGLVRLFSNSSTEIFINEKELEFINFLLDDNYEDIMRKFFLSNGFPEGFFENLLKNRSRIKEIIKDVNFNEVKDNDKIEIAGSYVQTIWTPGHTIGHTCVQYDDELFCGDHILPSITPNVSLLRIEDNPLEGYFNSLDRVERINPRTIYPAHGNPFNNVKERIEEIKRHHQKRINEILSILGRGKSTAYEVGRSISWYKPWDQLGNMDKQLAAGETLAHLKYLLEKGIIKEEINGGIVYYSI